MAPKARLLAAVLLWSAAMLLAACGGPGGGGGGGDAGGGGGGDESTVYAGVPIPPGEECAFGGVRIDYGIDENGNGLLDAEEVDGYSVVCNGAGSSANPIVPPAGPAAQYTIDLHGGTSNGSDGANGGNGGSLELHLNSSGTGHIKLFNTGQADASFEFPDTVTTYLGPVPLQVPDGETMTVLVYPAADDSGVAVGEFHTHANDANLYRYNGKSDSIVTGIAIGAGARLGLGLNFTSYAYVQVAYDVRNEGVLTTALIGTKRGDLNLFCELYYGAPKSKVQLNGVVDQGKGVGGDGGNFYLLARSTQWGLPTGAIYNQGIIDTSGANGTSGFGGGGGYVSLNANLALLNTGNIDASGGDGVGDTGGPGDSIYLNGYQVWLAQAWVDMYAHVFNSGRLDSHGGNGTEGAPSGLVTLAARGDIRNAGDIDAHGGNGSLYDGGTAGDVDGQGDYTMDAYGGSVISSGDIDLHGGKGGDGYDGGSGGPLYIRTHGDSAFIPNGPAGSIILSGNIDAYGGDGFYAGTGGGVGAQGVYLEVNGQEAPSGQEIQLLGYAGIDLSGGAANDGGGDAGGLLAFNTMSTVLDGAGDPVYGPAGGIYDRVPLKAKGGDSQSSTGGGGGTLQLEVDLANGYIAPWQIASNFANAELSGGFGTNAEGGPSGTVRILGPGGAENHGDLTVNGGDGLHYGGGPGNPGRVGPGIFILATQGPAINSGTIHADGGAITTSGTGGQGNLVEIIGRLAVHTGALISAVGGNSQPGQDSSSGDGGTVYILSTQGLSTVTGDIDASGGTGDGDGAPGVVFIDGINRSEDYVMVP